MWQSYWQPLRAGHAMEWKIVWNGRRILVWNMEDVQNGMEDLKNEMEGRLSYFHTNYKFYLFIELQHNGDRLTPRHTDMRGKNEIKQQVIYRKIKSVNK